MRLNFATGLLAGVVLASVLVVGFSYPQGGSAVGLMFVPASAGEQATSVTSTITLSSTSQVVASTSTSTSSSLISQGAASVAISTRSNLTSTVAAGNSSASLNGALSTVRFSFVPAVQSPSSLAAMVDQPGRIPLLLVPVLIALVLGFVIFRTSKQKE